MVSRTTIRDVAALAGVSTATVSNTLSGKKSVNPEIARQVIEAARQLNYRVDRAASQLRSGRVEVVGVLVPNLNDTFFANLVTRIEILAGRDGFQTLIATSHDSAQTEGSRLDAILGWRPSGLIVVPCSNEVPVQLQREYDGLPMVLADRLPEVALPVDTVQMNNLGAGIVAAEALIARGAGEILIASSRSDICPIAKRIEGVAQVCAQRGLPAPKVLDVGWDVSAGALRIGRWLDENPCPQSIIATTNVTTLAVLSALASRQLEAGRDLALIGIDDAEWMHARRMPIAAVHQPVDAMAEAIWDLLSQRMKGSREPPRHRIFDPMLIERDSLGRVQHGGADP